MIDAFIRKMERCGPLTEIQRQVLNSLPDRYREYDRGDLIVRQGDDPKESVIVLKGYSCRFKTVEGGARQILALQVPGDFTDLHSLVLHPIDHSVDAVTACFVARVPHERLKAIIGTDADLTRRLMWDMALDAAITREWMTSLGRRSALQHTAHFLCELYFRLKQVSLLTDHTFELPFSQVEMADVLGISAVHVNRSIQNLRREGLIELTGKKVRILDLRKAIETAEFDPAYLHLLDSSVPVDE